MCDVKCLLITLLCCVLCNFISANQAEVEKMLKDLEIIPDVLIEASEDFLQVEYAGEVKADRGIELTPTATKDAPKLTWNAEPDAFYTVIMSNVDPPSRAEPIWREWLHWLVVNIPGMQLEHGEVFDPYLGPAPPKGNGLLRYVFLVYRQPEKLQFNEIALNNTSTAGHANFSSVKFAEKYGFDKLVAANAFQAAWDELVPSIYKQLGIDL